MDIIATKELYNNLPQMPIRERDRRWKATRDWMTQEGIDCLLVIGNDLTFGLGMANFRYLSNCAPRHGGFLVFPLKGEPVIFSEPYHMTRPIHPCLLAHDWVKEVHDNRGIENVLDNILERISPLKKVGLVSGANTVQYENMPYDIYARIHERLKGVEIVNASKFLFDLRSIKSDDEIAFLREAGKIHRKVLQAKIDTAAEGVREAEVFAAMMGAMLANGGESQGFNLLHSGPISSPECQHLLHGLDSDMSPSMRMLRTGDTVISETHVSYGGYMTAAEFTVCVGQPPKEYERLYDAGVECLNAALENLKPGYAFIDAIEAEKAVLKKYGYDWLELGFHGHGLGSPEPPKVVLMGSDESTIPSRWRVSQAQKEVVFKKNMVFGTNIDLFDPGFRLDVGIMFGDCVVIGETPELLVHTPQTLPIK
ncbi:MAG: M24 family metallopeptidase [Ignavibacteriales bacterium]